MAVARDGNRVVFPVTTKEAADGTYAFVARDVRPVDYTGYLEGWSEADRDQAPRAFEQLGDICIIKIPPDLWQRRADVGDALAQFTSARAVFHDHGVKGEYRCRDLERLAGTGTAETTVVENGAQLVIDVTKAYYSPRLATERQRLLNQLAAGASVIDLFCGIGPLVVQAARAGAHVTACDLNPAAVQLAKQNLAANDVTATISCADARVFAADLAASGKSADHVVMNLPHGAMEFVDAAAPLVAAGGRLHYHEIMDDGELEARQGELVQQLAQRTHGPWHVETARHVRTYAPGTGHYALDLRRGTPA